MNKISNPLVSVIIPAFNEGKTIGNVLANLLRFLNTNYNTSEVIVIDDGSIDDTNKVAVMSGVKVLRNHKNQGKGFALQRGFECALGKIIVTMDADGSHDPEEIGKLVNPVIGGADMVIGSRFMDGNGENSTSKLRVFGNYLINLAILLMTGKRVTDSQTGFRAVKSEIIKSFTISSVGYQIETELTVKILKNFSVVKEVSTHPIRRIRGKSNINPLLDGLRIFRTIFECSISQDNNSIFNGSFMKELDKPI